MVAERNKRGSQGAASAYITRAKALRKLQLSLSDFRRLCILKGIFPRYPRNKFEGANRTYYLKKDVQFLAHEPLIGKFRELAAYLRRYRRALARGEPVQATFLGGSKPLYSLSHLVRERYPSFRDALEELDDALTMVHLFAELPPLGRQQKGISRTLFGSARLANCVRLVREWQYFLIAHPGCLRRVFVGVRGFYFEARIEGVRLLWSQPHRFVQHVPSSVDLKVMSTFLEFYETLMHFVLLRLYRQILGLQYPPRIDRMGESRGALIRQVVQARKLHTIDPAKQAGSTKERGEEVFHEAATPLPMISNEGSTQSSVKSIVASGDAGAVDVDEEDPGTWGTVEAPALGSTAPPPSTLLNDLRNADGNEAALASLFSGLYFYLHRETPIQILEMVLYACGAELVGYENPCAGVSPLAADDGRITHVIADRSLDQLPDRRLDRDYVQPQWVFDSINEVFRLPTWLYRLGRRLPPHLSPWESEQEDDNQRRLQRSNAAPAGTRRPAYRLYLDRLKRGEPSMPLPQELEWLEQTPSWNQTTDAPHSEATLAHAVSASEPEESDHEEDFHGETDKDGASSSGVMKRSGSDRALEEERMRQRMLLSRRKQRLYDRMAARQEAKQTGTAPALIKRPRVHP